MLDVDNLTEDQRTRVAKDIVNHEAESRGPEETYPDEEVNARMEELVFNTSDSELLSVWMGNVGEWLNSIGNEYPAFVETWESGPESRFDSPAEWQLSKLVNGEELDYGYQFYVFTQPYDQ